MKLYINKNLKSINVLNPLLNNINLNFQPEYCTALEGAIKMKVHNSCLYIDYQNQSNLMIINSLNNDVCFLDNSCVIDLSKTKLAVNITSLELLDYYSTIIHSTVQANTK